MNLEHQSQGQCLQKGQCSLLGVEVESRLMATVKLSEKCCALEVEVEVREASPEAAVMEVPWVFSPS